MTQHSSIQQTYAAELGLPLACPERKERAVVGTFVPAVSRLRQHSWMCGALSLAHSDLLPLQR